MRHFYVSCPTCRHRRLHLIGQSSERFGSPPTPAERYYQGPNYGQAERRLAGTLSRS